MSQRARLIKTSLIVLSVFWVFTIGSTVWAQATQTCNPSLIHQITVGNNILLGNLAWSPDGEYIAVNYADIDEFDHPLRITLRLYSTETMGIANDFDLPLSASLSSPIVWSPDGTRVAVSNDSTTLIANVETGNVLTLQDPDFEQFIRQTVWSNDGTQLATVSHNREHWSSRIPLGEIVRIWDVANETVVTNYGNGLLQARVAKLENEWFVAVRSENDDRVSLIQLATGTALFEQENVYVTDLVAVSDHLRLATTQFIPDIEADDAQAVLEIWNVTAQEQEFELSGSPNSIAASALISGTDLLIARIAILESVVHDLSTGFSLSFERQGIFPSLDGELLAVFGTGQAAGSAEGTTPPSTGQRSLGPPIQLIRMDTGATITTIHGDGSANIQPWSPDGEMLVVTFDPNRLGIWSLEGCQ